MFKFSKNLIFIILLVVVSSCGNNFFKRSDVKDNPVNVDERVQRNIKEGKGIRFGKFGNNKGGTFDFASSNELWRASVEILNFVPLTNASYSGGIIITEWFNGNEKDNNRYLKITVRFLSNEIRIDALDVTVHEKICNNNVNDCKINLIQSEISEQIKVAILKKAALLERNSIDKQDIKVPKKIR